MLIQNCSSAVCLRRHDSRWPVNVNTTTSQQKGRLTQKKRRAGIVRTLRRQVSVPSGCICVSLVAIVTSRFLCCHRDISPCVWTGLILEHVPLGCLLDRDLLATRMLTLPSGQYQYLLRHLNTSAGQDFGQERMPHNATHTATSSLPQTQKLRQFHPPNTYLLLKRTQRCQWAGQ